jgi:hypothetical protein
MRKFFIKIPNLSASRAGEVNAAAAAAYVAIEL